MNPNRFDAAAIRVAALPRGARRAVAVVAFAIVTAVAARISVPLPGLPVPLTMQPAAVLLAGLVLGARLGAASQVAYLMAGIAGAPVFAAGGGAAYLLGPTGGYLLAFPLAAAVAGGMAGAAPGLGRALLAGLLGLVTIHAGGLAWLAAMSGGAASAVGIVPFLAGDALKLLLAVVLARKFAAGVRGLCS